ncbi:MAG TPA: hypothetical protein ENN65_09125 [Candidatus Hydrogenedentes bacterium]|mgnify:FL=1|nr:hypothetical protein [Candidatus Hydrogenedentota bacterium]
MKKGHAALIALTLTLWAYALATLTVGDGMIRAASAAPGRELRAAVAIRDDVTPFQKWGTKMFTWGYLRRYYDVAWYFTQSRENDQEESLLASLNIALERYPQVDVFLLAHDNRYLNWVAALPAERRQRLRFVYNTGCHNQPQGPRWITLGADAYVGHPGYSLSPFFYYYFLRRWTRGHTIQEATEESNRLMERAFKTWERLSFGRVNAAHLMRESVAAYHGNDQLRLGGLP